MKKSTSIDPAAEIATLKAQESAKGYFPDPVAAKKSEGKPADNAGLFEYDDDMDKMKQMYGGLFPNTGNKAAEKPKYSHDDLIFAKPVKLTRAQRQEAMENHRLSQKTGVYGDPDWGIDSDGCGCSFVPAFGFAGGLLLMLFILGFVLGLFS